MKLLTYNGVCRHEIDQSVIDNLLRKGWIDATPPEKPEQPEYNSSVEYLVFDSETNLYSKIPYSEEELASIDLMKRREDLDRNINNGFLVEPENFVLGLSDSDRSAFTQMLSLIKEALDLELITNDEPQTISDKSGQKHQITTLRFRQIMVAYGFYYKTLWDQLS